MSDRPVLLIDVMGTLVRDPFYSDMAPFFGLTFEQLLEQKHPTAWIEFECGRIDEAELLERFFLDGRAVDGEALKRTMRAGYEWLPGMEPLLSALAAAEVEMHLLSNYPEWYRLIEDKLRLSRFAPWSFVSWHTGLHKPDPEVYRHAARELDRPPQACVLVDDREVNCAGAESIGMGAVRYRDAPSLIADLAAFGIAVEP